MNVEQLMEENTYQGLLNIVRDMDVSGYSGKNKGELAEFIVENQKEEVEVEETIELEDGEEIDEDNHKEKAEEIITIQTNQPVSIRIRGVVDVPMERNMPVAKTIEVPAEYADEVKRVLKDAYGEDIIK